MKKSEPINMALTEFSKVALQFMYTYQEAEKTKRQYPSIQATDADLVTRRNPGFTLASIMGKIDQEQVNCHNHFLTSKF